MTSSHAAPPNANDRRVRVMTALSRLAGVRAVILEEVLEEPLRRTKKVARNLKMLRISIIDLRDLVSVEAEQRSAGITEDDRRVRRDQELRVTGRRQVVNDLQKRQLALR